jgi:hypothetical protein
MGINLHDKESHIIPPIQERSIKDETCVAACVTGSNHSSNSVMSVSKEFETADHIRSFATKITDSVSQREKSVSTMGEQVQPLEIAVSFVCISSFHFRAPPFR